MFNFKNFLLALQSCYRSICRTLTAPSEEPAKQFPFTADQMFSDRIINHFLKMIIEKRLIKVTTIPEILKEMNEEQSVRTSGALFEYYETALIKKLILTEEQYIDFSKQCDNLYHKDNNQNKLDIDYLNFAADLKRCSDKAYNQLVDEFRSTHDN